MKLIVGLGNPGPNYATTRHNAGFLVVDRFRLRHRQPEWSRALSLSTYCTTRMAGSSVRLMKPLTMMNQSGEALRVAVSRWRVAPADTLVVCDDVNLPLGSLRLRPQGSDGGHHGLASCLEQLETTNVPRLRVGIGVQPLPKELTEFVLSPFAPGERPLLHETLDRAVEACELWATHDIHVAMNRINPHANRPVQFE